MFSCPGSYPVPVCFGFLLAIMAQDFLGASQVLDFWGSYGILRDGHVPPGSQAEHILTSRVVAPTEVRLHVALVLAFERSARKMMAAGPGYGTSVSDLALAARSLRSVYEAQLALFPRARHLCQSIVVDGRLLPSQTMPWPPRPPYCRVTLEPFGGTRCSGRQSGSAW